MERYTYKKDHYGCEDILSKYIYPRYEDGNDKPVAYYGQAIDKLAEYEDTGLAPEQIKELLEQSKKSTEECEPEYLGENIAIGCREGKCRCGNIVRSYQKFCFECGKRLEWGCVHG